MLALEGYEVSHGRAPVLALPRLQVPAGTIVALVGRSGCGKTTLLDSLSGLRMPLRGAATYMIDGVSTSALPRGSVGRSFQGCPLLPWFTVRAQFRMRDRMSGLHSDVVSILADFRATQFVDRYPSTLSGGERARCALALALAEGVRFVFLDEPFNGLDLWLRANIIDAVRTRVKDRQLCCLAVLHDLHDVSRLADRVVFLAGSPAVPVRSIGSDDQRPTIAELEQAVVEFS